MRKIQGNKCASLAPWADTTAKQNLWVCHSNWTPRCKSYFCKNLKMFGVYSVVEKRVCLQISGILGNSVVLVVISGAQGFLLPLWQDAH